MVNTTKIIEGKFCAAPEFMIRKSESESGVLEVRDVGDGKVMLTIRESEFAAGVGIMVDREELEKAL